MVNLKIFVVFTALFLNLVAAWDINSSGDRRKCQSPSGRPLDGCDKKRTIYVSAEDPRARYRTVQSAVLSLPKNKETYIILIGSGNYTEQVNVTRPGPTYLLGQTAQPRSHALNTVNIIWAAAAGLGDNAFTSTLTVAPNLNASLTGAGPTGFAVPDDTPFGCVDFRTYNLNFINDFAPYSATPSLALSISRANGGFYYTGFYSYQDTVYVGKLGNAYMKGGEVAGQTDFFYGFGTCFVTNTVITLRSCGGGITAWKGTNTTHPNKYGIYITDSTILPANASLLDAPAPGTKTPYIYHRCALGRPWNPQMRSIIAHTYMSEAILPTGYIDWSPARYDPALTLQAEYENYGPGWNLTAREGAQFEVLLTQRQWGNYDSPKEVFEFGTTGRFGNDGWVDYEA